MKQTLTVRRITLTLLVVMIVFDIMVTISDLMTPDIAPALVYTDLFLFFVCCLFLWAAWKNWTYTGLGLVIFYIVLVGFAMPEPYLTQRISLTIFIPPILAMVLISPLWIMVSGLSTMLILLGRANWQGVYADVFNLLVYCMSIAGLVLGRIVANTATRLAEAARTDAERSSQALQIANETLEQRVLERTADVQAKLAELQEQAVMQTRLISENEQQRELIRNLSVPVIPVTRTTLVMPLVGELTQQRMEDVHHQVLRALSQGEANTLVIDITGVPIVDAAVAQGILRIAQAAQLLGGQVALVGIRPEVAQAIVSLGIEIGKLQTYANLESALARRQ